jgi:ABC-2 type transport system permease protein
VRALVRAELLKLRTTRTFVALVASALALSLLLVTLTAALEHGFSKDDVRQLFTSDFTGLFMLMLGVMGAAGEWRHRTITSTVLAAPDRLRLLAAKAVSYAAVGALVSLLVTVAMMALGSAILSSEGETTLGLADLADLVWRNMTVAATAGAFGVGIGALVRNQVVAIVGLILLALAIEPALLGLAPEVGRFGPLLGLPAAIAGNPMDDPDVLETGVALLVMLGWVGAAFAAGAVALRRRDLV